MQRMGVGGHKVPLIVLCKLPNLTCEVSFFFMNHHFIILLLGSNFECRIYFNGEVIEMLDGMEDILIN